MLGWLPQGAIAEKSVAAPFLMPCEHGRGSLLSTYENCLYDKLQILTSRYK